MPFFHLSLFFCLILTTPKPVQIKKSLQKLNSKTKSTFHNIFYEFCFIKKNFPYTAHIKSTFGLTGNYNVYFVETSGKNRLVFRHKLIIIKFQILRDYLIRKIFYKKYNFLKSKKQLDCLIDC